jgi:hypothetical protein
MVAEARERAVAAGEEEEEEEEEEGGETISQCPRDLAPPAAVLLRKETEIETEVETQTEVEIETGLPAVMTEVAGMVGASGGEAAGAPVTRERGPATDTSLTGEEAVVVKVVGEGVLVPAVGVTPTAAVPLAPVAWVAVRVLVGVAVVGASR